MQTWTRSLALLPHAPRTPSPLPPLPAAHTNLSQVLFLQPPLIGLCSLDTFQDKGTLFSHISFSYSLPSLKAAESPTEIS